MRLTQFATDAGQRPYRDLIQHHLSRQTAQQLRDAAMGEVLALPSELQPLAESYFDELNGQLLTRQDFWRQSSCRDAINAVLTIANKHFGLSFRLPVDPVTMSGVEQELAFELFQIATLSFAYNAVDQAGARQFMGIRAPFPWASSLALVYPLAAGAWAYQQAGAGGHSTPLAVALGYSMANLGYLLLASGIIFGRFGALSLRRRPQVLLAGAAAVFGGILISNIWL